jgi:hypothetical protein
MPDALFFSPPVATQQEGGIDGEGKKIGVHAGSVESLKIVGVYENFPAIHEFQ